MSKQVLEVYKEVKRVVEEAEVDATKSARGVHAAGVRLRKSVQQLRELLTTLKKESLREEGDVKEASPLN